MRIAALLFALSSALAWASPLSPEAKAMIPDNVRQLISVDYHMLRSFSAAMALKGQVLPENLRQFEIALKSVGVNPDTDLQTLTYISFGDGIKESQMVALATGTFAPMGVLTQLRLQKLKSVKYANHDLYSLSKTLSLTFFENNTLLLGSAPALKEILDIRPDHASPIDANPDLSGAIRFVEKATVWSVLDRVGTQKMLLSALGDPVKLADFTKIREKILCSYFRMNFKGGVRFDMDVLTSDSNTSSQISALLKLGILYKKVTGNPAQRTALDNVTVTSKRVVENLDRSDLKMRFAADQQKLQILLRSQCFTAMSSERKEFSGFSSAVVKDDANPAGDQPTRPNR